MDVIVTATPDAFTAAVRLLRTSIARGDFDDDEEFADAAAKLSGALEEAAEHTEDEDEDIASAEVDAPTLDQVLAIVEGDPAAEAGPLASFVAAGNTALDNAPTVSV